MSESGITERVLRRDRSIVLAAIATIFLVAAAYTIAGVGMPMSAVEMTGMRGTMPSDRAPSLMAEMPAMGMLTMPANWTPGYAALVFSMWWLMMVAMMLPSAAPTILLYSTLQQKSAGAVSAAPLATVFLTGYLVVWAGFGFAATGLQWSLELRGLVSPARMALTSGLIGGCVLLAAALYQLSPLKRVCLEHCRSPIQFLVERRRAGLAGAFRMGLEHGAFCVGCCWFLMALLFVGGIMNLYWIAGLAILVALEKLAPIGRQIAKASSIVLGIAGLWMLWQAVA